MSRTITVNCPIPGHRPHTLNLDNARILLESLARDDWEDGPRCLETVLTQCSPAYRYLDNAWNLRFVDLDMSETRFGASPPLDEISDRFAALRVRIAGLRKQRDSHRIRTDELGRAFCTVCDTAWPCTPIKTLMASECRIRPDLEAGADEPRANP